MGLFNRRKSAEHDALNPPAPDESSDTRAMLPSFADAVRFTLSKPDPLDTFIAQTDGGIAYRTVTKSSKPIFGTDITTITRADGGQAREIAKVDWHHFEQDEIEVQWAGGEKVKTCDYLTGNEPQYGVYQRRSFRVKEQELTWRWKQDHFELLDSKDSPLARDARVKKGFFIPTSASGGLLVVREALDILDQIVVTYIILAQWQRMASNMRRDPGAALIVQGFK